jgi:phosphate transport system permease protein
VPNGLLILCIAFLGVLGWMLGSWRAHRVVKGKTAQLHSRPHYYGASVLLWTVLPALALVSIWLAAEPIVIGDAVFKSLPEQVQAESPAVRSLTMGTIDAVARGLRSLTPGEIADARAGRADIMQLLESKGIAIAAAPRPYMVNAAVLQNSIADASRLMVTIGGLGIAGLGFAIGLLLVSPKRRARNGVERVMLIGLGAASTVAILTTAGIVLSMLFETLHFFSLVSLQDFFFGTVWDPRFSAAGRAGGSEGQFGLLPLLWGTAYISIVALAVAVPVGLFSAIYMSEYASRNVRTVVKPLLEILAGIPTIVYGFFALVTFGPFIRDLGASVGLSISATSVLTAGFIMGVMLIPFVSSLSDDIINAVPQSLRDGSYGLGATKSETIKRVVLPAALPGIVGAVLLAASRAIGETMIVVLAAGIAANLTLNVFEPVTTITVKIVSQLTGDLEFNSPQTLVAFALGLTLFVVTLALNIYALYIVRKYREQYE